jgi:glycosidase
MLAEASKPELLVKAFDIDYSWPLLAKINDVFTRNAPASNIRHSWEKSHAQFPRDALNMRISDDHDEDRAIARFGLNGALAASALVFTLDGVPLLYNGMEVGDSAETSGNALFERRPISWMPKQRPPLREIYHDLIQLRHQYAALRNLRVDWLSNSDETHLLTFMRADDKDELLVLINCFNQPVTGKVDLKNGEGFVPVEMSGAWNSDRSRLPGFHLDGFEWRIYHRGCVSLHSMPSAAAKSDSKL